MDLTLCILQGNHRSGGQAHPDEPGRRPSRDRTMAIHGGANRYTNIIFAEDENGLPPGWKPLSVERGYAPGRTLSLSLPLKER